MSQPSYLTRRSTAQHSDTKLLRWARRLGKFQDDARPGSPAKYNPAYRDTPHRILWKLGSALNSSNGDWTSVARAVQFGQGKPHGTPSSKHRVWVQRDSVPPWKIWIYYKGAWIE